MYMYAHVFRNVQMLRGRINSHHFNESPFRSEISCVFKKKKGGSVKLRSVDISIPFYIVVVRASTRRMNLIFRYMYVYIEIYICIYI